MPRPTAAYRTLARLAILAIGDTEQLPFVPQVERLATTTGGTEPGDGQCPQWCRIRDESSPYADRWAAPSDPDCALDELVSAAARVLAARADAPIAFCHAVTAPAAVRLVLPILSPEVRMLSVAASWHVVGAIISAFAATRLEEESLLHQEDTSSLQERLAPLAAEHGDEHLIKLTEAALREFPRTEDATLLIAADRFRLRIPAP